MAERYLATKVVMMPRDTNPAGTIFGGVLLGHIDMAAYVGARWATDQRKAYAPTLVTVAMDKVIFKEPVLVGDTVSFFASCTKVGRTSVTIHIEVETERKGKVVAVTQADVVFVAVEKQADGTLKPVPLGVPQEPLDTSSI